MKEGKNGEDNKKIRKQYCFRSFVPLKLIDFTTVKERRVCEEWQKDVSLLIYHSPTKSPTTSLLIDDITRLNE